MLFGINSDAAYAKLLITRSVQLTLSQTSRPTGWPKKSKPPTE